MNEENRCLPYETKSLRSDEGLIVGIVVLNPNKLIFDIHNVSILMEYDQIAHLQREYLANQIPYSLENEYVPISERY